MKRIVFSIMCIALIQAAFADINVPPKNAQLVRAAKDSNLPSVQTEQKEDKFQLSDAANKGDIEKVRELIAKGYNVNTRDEANWTPLHRAIFMGHKEIAKLLIANGADVNAKNNIGVIPIMLAVIRDYNDIVELLIKNGAQKTIYVAAAQGDIESAKTFLKKDPNLVNALASNDGWSALHWAAYMNRLDVIKLLIENGVDVNIRDRINDVTPLYWAVHKGHLDAAKLLIAKGADVKIKFKNGGTILHGPGTLETAKLLIDNRADVNAKDDHGTTPLHSIADKGGLNAVQRVLFDKNGGTVDTYKTDFEKYRDAAEKVTAEIAELLIKNGADINAKDEKGNTPLSLAKAAKNKALIELLGKYNAKDKMD
jgi:ankyrin repeat protein